ncbi:MAG: hypothetical protein A2X64_09675 [Ignavibacteria bacterium GWF2_33_9]|nr:MAG: hypothetical protein A2X64_09675 [Ignavibacteria bacterium GWF2_33_9]
MIFKEMELPGIGKKFTFQIVNGAYLSVVVLINGKREIFLFDDPEDDAKFHFLLNEEEANLLGSILMGNYFKPEQEKQKQLLIDKLSIEWVNLTENSSLVNSSILESGIRKKTGITIISIIRNDDTIINPAPDTQLLLDDTLVVVGSREQTRRFKELFNISE